MRQPAHWVPDQQQRGPAAARQEAEGNDPRPHTSCAAANAVALTATS